MCRDVNHGNVIVNADVIDSHITLAGYIGGNGQEVHGEIKIGSDGANISGSGNTEEYENTDS